MVYISWNKRLNELKKIFGQKIAINALSYTLERDNIDSMYKTSFEKKILKIKGPFRGFEEFKDAIYANFTNGYAKINFIEDDIIKINWYVKNSETDQKRKLNEEKIIEKNNIKIKFSNQGIDLFYKNEWMKRDHFPILGSIRQEIDIRNNSSIHGTGERAFPFDLRGRKIVLWNHDANGSYGPGSDPLYLNIPIIIDIKKDLGYATFYDNPSKGIMDICQKYNSKIITEFSNGSLEYYIIFGDLKKIIEKMSGILGKPMLPPKWAFGFHQSRYSYYSQKEVENLFNNFIKYDLPISAIHLDIDYMDDYKVFSKNSKTFPDLNSLSKKLMEKEVRLVAILDPGIKWDIKFDLYQESYKNNYLIRDFEGNIIKAPVWPGLTVFPDFSNENVRKWWSEKYRFFTENGISGVWHDMNEPAVFVLWGDNTLPNFSVQSQGFHIFAHNLYGLQMAEAGYNGLMNALKGERPFLLSRSGWAGIQKYAFVWTGDTESTWDTLEQTVSTILNLSMSGISYTGVDIGGFSGSPSDDLFLRWFQLGAFLPFFRVHSSKKTKRREPWVFGEDILSIIRKYLKLRYSLIPYIYSLSFESHTKGYPIIRPLIWNYPDNLNDKQFLLGDFILVVPVLKKDLSKMKIHLPDGKWYDFWGDNVYEGIIKMKIDLEKIPLFIKSGSIIPFKNKELEFHVYPGESCKFIFYDDDSMVNPKYIKIEFEVKNNSEKIIISWEFSGSLKFDKIKFVLHGKIKKEAFAKIEDKFIEL